MSNQAIQLADLSHIFRALNEISTGVVQLRGDVTDVDQKVATTQGELQLLREAFSDFVAADLRAKEVQLAETRQVKVRQELETKYGHYATIRRHATGVLQAADLSLVRQETITWATEELMLMAPGYWLAPALLALGAWLRDDQELATKAIAEAARRDDEKTSLFLALIGRRAGRTQVCRQWLDRFFAMQDPTRLDRQTVVLVDALASGVFGVEVRQTCSTRLASWVEELGQQVDFVAEQRRAWGVALMSKTSSKDRVSDYRYLAKHSPTWDALQKSLNGAAAHGAILEHFKAIFDGQIVPSPSLQAAVDEFLNKLVSNFDDEELPLRRSDRLLELVIQENGDKAAAQAKFDAESSALEEHVSFMQLLTNAAMHPETSHASKATQRLAISVSRQWIKEAYSDVLAALRQSVPVRIQIALEGWEGETTDGSNETELLGSLGAHFDQLKKEKLAALQFGAGHWIGAAGGAALLLFGAASQAWIVAIIGAALLVGMGITWSNQNTARQKLEAEHTAFVQSCEGMLKACLSEVVEWRREYVRADATSEEVTTIFERLSPSQHIHTAHDTSRQITATAG